MNTHIAIDASRARNDFLKLLDAVYLENKRYIVKKSGIPVAIIRKFDTSSESSRVAREDAFDTLRKKYGYPLEGINVVSEIRKMRRSR